MSAQEPNAKTIDVETPVKTSTNPRALGSFVTQPCYSNNTVPIDLSYYKKDEKHYAVLETSYSYTGTISRVPYIKIVCNGLIDRISLDDFPMGQYTLELNDHNCATALFNPQRGCCEFDFTGKRSGMLNTMITLSASEDEPKSTPLARENYVNFGRIEHIRIHYPPTLVLKEKLTMSLHGYFPESVQSNTYVEDTEKRTVYPHNTYHLILNQPTDSIDILVDQASCEDGIVILELNGYEVARSTCHVYSGAYEYTPDTGVRVKFTNPHRYLMGRQNHYLSDEINQNTLNLSMVDSITLICIGCNPVNIVQSLYNVYHYPSRKLMYTS